MVSLTLLIVVVFVIGYLCIALEGFTKINKAAIALLMFVGCWTLFMINPGEYLTGLTPETTASTIAGTWKKNAFMAYCIYNFLPFGYSRQSNYEYSNDHDSSKTCARS